MTALPQSETAPSSQTIDFQIWKTIIAGNWPQYAIDRSWFSLVDTLDQSGFSVGKQVTRCFGETAFTDQVFLSPTKIDLYLATVKELTGQDKLSLREVLISIRKKGYSLCSPEVGPRLRMEFTDQPKLGRIYVAMHPILNHIFLIAGRVASTDRDHLDSTCWVRDLNGSDQVVFTKCEYHR